MDERIAIIDHLAIRGVKVKPKSSSRLMRLLALVLGSAFMERFWTTIGPTTIWAPTRIGRIDSDSLERSRIAVEHELVHIEQARRAPLIWQLSYLLLPVPFLFAWCRWAWEREAYLVQVRASGLASRSQVIEDVCGTLWRHYGWCWPKPLMRRWFERLEGPEQVLDRAGIAKQIRHLFYEYDARPSHRDNLHGYNRWTLLKHGHGVVIERMFSSWVIRTRNGYDRPGHPPVTERLMAARHTDLISAMHRAVWMDLKL